MPSECRSGVGVTVGSMWVCNVHARAIEVGERECGGKRRGKRASVAGLDEGKCVGVVDHTQGIGHGVERSCALDTVHVLACSAAG